MAHVVAVGAAYLPFSIFLYGGAATASLWLDEILYRQLELDRALRAREFGRAGSFVATYFGKDVYCDFRAAFGAMIDALHLSPLLGVEASLRLLPILSSLTCVAVVYVVVLRLTGSLARAAVTASLLSTLPVFLQYAFEARSYAPSSLVALGFVLIAGRARRSARAAAGAALLGALAVLLHWWVVCLPAAVLLLATGEACRARHLGSEQRRLLATTVPALVLAAVQAWFLVLAPGASGAAFPLFRVRGLEFAIASTAAAPWIHLGGQPTLVRGLLLVAAAVLVAQAWRREGGAGAPLLRRVGPVALAGAVVVGAFAGNLVYSRHLVPVIVVCILAMGLASGRAAFAAQLLLVALNTGFLAHTFEVVTHKGNGRALAGIVAGRGDHGSVGIVVQQSLAAGYPDPANSFGLDFYLNDVRSGPKVPIYELPSMEDVSGRRGVFAYFGGGEELLARYATWSRDRWVRWLREGGQPVLWLVTPVALLPVEADLRAAFRRSLAEVGYRAVPGASFLLGACPPTVIERFERSPSS